MTTLPKKPKRRWCLFGCGLSVYHVKTRSRSGVFKCEKCGEEFNLEQVTKNYTTQLRGSIIKLKKRVEKAETPKSKRIVSPYKKLLKIHNAKVKK